MKVLCHLCNIGGDCNIAAKRCNFPIKWFNGVTVTFDDMQVPPYLWGMNFYHHTK